MKICPEHKTEFNVKSPNKGGFYWHSLGFDKGFCSKTKEEYDALPSEQETAPLPEPTREATADASPRKLDGMIICNAMNNAVALFVAEGIQASLPNERGARVDYWFDVVLKAFEKRA